MRSNDENLHEPMDMPDPLFPIKVHKVHRDRPGAIMFPHHWHRELEFLYFVDGHGQVECGGARLDVQPGDLVAVNSNELHYGVTQSREMFYYALIADPSLLHSSIADNSVTKFITPLQQNRLLLYNHIRGDDAVASSILAIVHELDNKDFGYELAIKSELYRLLTLLLRGHIASVISQEEHSAHLKNMKRFGQVLEYIQLNYSQPISVDTLSGIAGLSRYYFSRLFKEVTGRTVPEYITTIRLDKADCLLLQTELTISEIAVSTGFNDVFYFSRIFSKHKKMTPSERRRSHIH